MSVSVCVSVTRLRCAKTAELIEQLFGAKSFVEPMPRFPIARGPVNGGKFCPLQNIRTLMLGFDAAFAKLLWPLVKVKLFKNNILNKLLSYLHSQIYG